MIIEKKKNAKNNVINGGINKVVSLVMPFIMNYVFVHTMGMQYLGVNSLFTSILNVLSLSELGIGTAITYSMYKSIANDDKDSICAFLDLLKKTYSIIGIVILIIGLCLIPFLDVLIKGAYPSDVDIVIVYAIFLMKSVVSYWLFAYKNALFNAYQRTDVLSKINTIVSVVSYIVQTVFLIFRAYYAYLFTMLIAVIVTNIFIEYESVKIYPDIVCKGIIKEKQKLEIRRSIAGLVISKVSGATRNTFDSIFMSMFVGLAAAGIYNNYFLVINSLFGVLIVLSSSIEGGIGNDIVIRSADDNYKSMMMLNRAFMILSCFMTVYLNALFQPFMSIWMGKNVFPDYVAVLFTMYFYLQTTGIVRCLYSNGRGLFWDMRYQSILECILNIILNYVLAKNYGAAGIVVATLISLGITSFYAIFLLFKHYFRKGMKEFLLEHFFMAILTTVVCIFSKHICCLFEFNGYLTIIIRIVICSIILLVVSVVLYSSSYKYRQTFIWIYKLKD